MTTCPHCGKPTTDVTVDDDCGAELQPNGHESFTCWGVPHDGPHAALANTPCPGCGGFDEHGDALGQPGTPCPHLEDDGNPICTWLQWDDTDTYWFVPGGWHSPQPDNIYWRGQRNFTASTSTRPSTRLPTEQTNPEPEAHPNLDFNTYLGLCEIAFAVYSDEPSRVDDAVTTWLDNVGRDFGYQPTDTWPIWIVAHLTPSARNTEDHQP